MKAMKRICAIGIVLISFEAYAETISAGDVTAELGPDFFFDDAAVGGGDQTVSNVSFDRDFGALLVGEEGSEILISGIGWASSIAGTTATQATVTITYLGSDGVIGGGDDSVVGSATDALAFVGAGEYLWRFDAPMIALIDGSNTMFRIAINTGGSGTIRFKTDGPAKLSVAGSSSALYVVNLALYRDVVAASNPNFARYATDGVVGSDFKWIMDSADALPQQLDMSFPGPVEIGSYHLFSGVNDANKCTKWRLLYQLDGSAWAEVPGSAVTGNSASERNIVFAPLLVDKVRLEITGNQGGEPRIREWALFPPNGGNGYPLGTGVTLDMAKDGLTTATSHAAGHYPRLASDGYLGTSWVSGTNGPHTIEFTLRDEIKIRSAHLYSGDGTLGSPIADFELEYSNDAGATWTPVPGGTVSGNTDSERVITFSSAFLAAMVRLTTTNAGPMTIREFTVFPENGLGGYAIHTDVDSGSPPVQAFETYSDSFYRIRPESTDKALVADSAGAALVDSTDLDTGQVYQLLLNTGTDHYRIFNRGSRECLAVKDASLVAGADIIEEPYGAFPSQQWRLVGIGGGRSYIENVWSRMRLEVDGNAVRQMPRNGSLAQQWNFDFLRRYPKKGAAGFPDLADDMGASWYYGWTANYVTSLNENVVDFNPMQWGKFNLDPDNYNTASQLPLTVRFPDWLSRGHPLVLLGFNEPDGVDQANLTVDQALELWPQVMAARLPLASPVAKGWTRTWMGDWMAEAGNRGYRVDYLAMHTYPGPDALDIVTNIESFSAAYGDRQVLLTEFGFVDWSDNQSWTENLLYNQMLELLWRMEDSTDCKRYSLFGFVESATYPQPADPTGRATRSNWKYMNGSFTPLGEAYMGWDGDTTPNGDQPYILHNRGFDMRVRNDGTTTVDEANIRTNDASVQVVFQSIGNGYYYIVSALDGKRLRKSSASTVEWAPSHATSTDAQWSWSLVEAGWQLVPNRTGGNLRYTDVAGVHMGTASGSYYHWFFVPPMNPVDNVDPAGPVDLAATPSFKRVDLSWTGSISADTVSYTVKRATTPGGPYQTLANGVVAHGFSDIGLTNGTTYYYVVESLDRAGNAGASSEVSATPVLPAPDTYANWVLYAFDGAPGGTDSSKTGNPDGDDYMNFAEYVFLLDPLAADAMHLLIDSAGSSNVVVAFRLNRHATNVVWSLQSSTNLLDAGSWTSCVYRVESQADIGDWVEYAVVPEEPLAEAAYFRIEAGENQ